MARTPEILEAVFLEMEKGRSLVSICEDPKFPSRSAVIKEIENNEELKHRYARAREVQADFLAEDVVRIADEEEDPHRARIRCDARRWYASKLRPKVYGDKQEVTVVEEPREPDMIKEQLGPVLDRLRRKGVL